MVNYINDKDNKDIDDNNDFKDINEKNLNLNAIDNIYNNYSLDKMKLYIVKGKNVTFRNSLANSKDLELFQKMNGIKPIKPLDLKNKEKTNELNS